MFVYVNYLSYLVCSERKKAFDVSWLCEKSRLSAVGWGGSWSGGPEYIEWTITYILCFGSIVTGGGGRMIPESLSAFGVVIYVVKYG